MTWFPADKDTATVTNTANDWLTYREAMDLFGIKKSALYGRLSQQVRVRQLPGDSKRWNRSDLENLSHEHTTTPTQPPKPSFQMQSAGPLKHSDEAIDAMARLLLSLPSPTPSR